MSWVSDSVDHPKIFPSHVRIQKCSPNFETRNCPRKPGRDVGGNRIGYRYCLRAEDRWTIVVSNDSLDRLFDRMKMVGRVRLV